MAFPPSGLARQRSGGHPGECAHSLYHPGCRKRDWLKVKAWRTLEVLVGGVQFDRDGRLEAVLVGAPADGPLPYAGRVEFGLGRFGQLGERLTELVSTDSPFDGEWKSNARRFWIRPELRIEIRALPLRPGGTLRHGTFVRPI